VNPVEVIYAAFPSFLYLSSPIAGALLEPLLEFQTTASLYSHGFAAPDLGMYSNFVACQALNFHYNRQQLATSERK